MIIISLGSITQILTYSRCDNEMSQFQQCPQPPPPPPTPQATVGHLRTLSVPAVGHLQFHCGPGAVQLHTQGRSLGIG